MYRDKGSIVIELQMNANEKFESLHLLFVFINVENNYNISQVYIYIGMPS